MGLFKRLGPLLIGVPAIALGLVGCAEVQNAVQDVDDVTNPNLYRVTATYDGSVGLLRLWTGAKRFAGREV